MYRYFKGKIRKFLADPPPLLEGIVEAAMPYMGTVHPADNFTAGTASAKARQLKEACDGGTDEDKIIDILAHHSNEQRQAIKKAYEAEFGGDLTAMLKKELRSDFEDVVVALLATPRVYDAMELRRAMSGPWTKEWPLIEILCTRTTEEKEAIKVAYKKEFGRDLQEDLLCDTTGYFEKLLISELNGRRDESSGVDKAQAAADAQAIIDVRETFAQNAVLAGEAQWGTDEAAITKILCHRNYDQLKATYEAYQKLAGRDIEDAIKSETSGNLQDALVAIVRCSRDPGRFFASRLYDAMKGLGTDESTLIRIMVSRCELDLAIIAELYDMEYGVKLYKAIDDECSGGFKKMLIQILGELAE